MRFLISFDIRRWLAGFKFARTHSSEVQGLLMRSRIPTIYYLLLYLGPVCLTIAVKGKPNQETEL
jgi:hypothetical protein